jgi:hypothetical protein
MEDNGPSIPEVTMRPLLLPALLLSLATGAQAGGLDSFLTSLNVQARADLPGFSAQVSAQFGVPQPRVEGVMRVVKEPADTFMVFQLCQMSGRPHEEVLKVYQTHRRRGWGEMAKALGIKPGSKEFHALKRGDLRFEGRRRMEDDHRRHEEERGDGDGHPGHGRGRDKEKHGKGRPW